MGASNASSLVSSSDYRRHSVQTHELSQEMSVAQRRPAIDILTSGPLDARVSESPALHVLLVDDEPDLRGAVAEALTQAGHVAAEADGVASAFAMLAHRSFDVILLDLVLIGGGLDASSEDILEMLAARHDAPPTLIFSADTSARTRAVAQRFGLSFVEKPFDLERLLGEIERTHRERRRPTRV